MHIDELDAQLRACLSEMRVVSDRCLRLEAAFIHLRQDVEAALRRAEERYASRDA
jgi:hypothetical protein